MFPCPWPAVMSCRRGDLNPHEISLTSPSSWRVCLFRHFDVWATEDNAASDAHQQETQRDNREDPDQRQDGRDPGEVALRRGRPECRATAAAEHVGQTATATAV